MKSSNNLILNGFDRCGSSAISRLLATHPQIELMSHPFNSGSIRHKMYQVMTDDIASNEDVKFFSNLEQGVFWKDYVVSPWFEKHSTSLEFVSGKFHVLKTTLNHLTIRWIKERFPGIEFWGIWRDPFDILASLVRNDFYGKWYTDALPQLTEALQESGDFPSEFASHCGGREKNEVRTIAFLIAVRSYYFFKYLEPGKLINYEIFKDDPSIELNKVIRHFDLAEYSFDGNNDKDYNVIGLEYEKGKIHRHLIMPEDMEFIEEIFDPLFKLMDERFGNGPWHNPAHPA